MNNRRFPKPFLYYAYENFHSHLPEELFFEDFTLGFKKANAQTFKHFGKACEEIDKLEDEEEHIVEGEKNK